MATLINPKFQLLTSEEMVKLSSKRHDIRKKHPDSITLFRVGDFYHLIGEDAQLTMRTLQIRPASIPVEGVHGIKQISFPHHALDTNIPKLVRSGLRVCIVEGWETLHKS